MNARTRSVDLQAKLFRGFSDASRLRIVQALRDEPLTVSEIVRKTGLSQSNASNHLACLRDCGLVATTQSGRYIHYALSDKRVVQLIRNAEDLLAEVAKGVEQCKRYELPRKRTRGSNKYA